MYFSAVVIQSPSISHLEVPPLDSEIINNVKERQNRWSEMKNDENYLIIYGVTEVSLLHGRLHIEALLSRRHLNFISTIVLNKKFSWQTHDCCSR